MIESGLPPKPRSVGRYQAMQLDFSSEYSVDLLRRDPDYVHDVIEWDVINWSRMIDVIHAAAQQLNPRGRRALCIGERHGGVSLQLAREGFEVVCSSYGGPTQRARELHQRYGVADSIEYQDVNVFEIPYGEAEFDLVAAKSVIGGLKLDYSKPETRSLENQRLAVSEIRRVLKPGGLYVGAENLKGTVIHRMTRNIVRRGKVGWRHLAIDEIDWLFAEFSSTEQVPYAVLPARSSGMLGAMCGRFNRSLHGFIPKSWCYISYVVAQK